MVLGRDPPSVATRHVDGAVLAAHHKIVDVSVGERHGGDSYSFGLLEHQLHTVLWGEEERSVNNKLPGQALCLDRLCQTQPIKVTPQFIYVEHLIKEASSPLRSWRC